MNKQRYIIKTPEIRKRAAQAVMAIRGDDNMEVLIQPHKDDKTAEQRGFLHLLCKALADETGYSMIDIKELVKMEVLGSHEVTVGGVTKIVTESSEKQNRENYSALIEGVYRIAANAGVILPTAQWRE